VLFTVITSRCLLLLHFNY